jgi:hypothetical protein
MPDSLRNLEWSDLFLGVALAGLVSLTGIAITAAAMPHNVDYYYVSEGTGSSKGICVQAHWTWHLDEIAYCSDDKDKALDFVQKANALLKK